MTHRSPPEKRNIGQEKNWGYRVACVVRAKVDEHRGLSQQARCAAAKRIFNVRHCPLPCVRGLVRCSRSSVAYYTAPILGTSLATQIVSPMHTAQRKA